MPLASVGRLFSSGLWPLVVLGSSTNALIKWFDRLRRKGNGPQGMDLITLLRYYSLLKFILLFSRLCTISKRTMSRSSLSWGERSFE